MYYQQQLKEQQLKARVLDVSTWTLSVVPEPTITLKTYGCKDALELAREYIGLGSASRQSSGFEITRHRIEKDAELKEEHLKLFIKINSVFVDRPRLSLFALYFMQQIKTYAFKPKWEIQSNGDFECMVYANCTGDHKATCKVLLAREPIYDFLVNDLGFPKAGRIYVYIAYCGVTLKWHTCHPSKVGLIHRLFRGGCGDCPGSTYWEMLEQESYN